MPMTNYQRGVFLKKAHQSILDTTNALNQALKLDATAKGIMLADLAGVFAFVAKEAAKSDNKLVKLMKPLAIRLHNDTLCEDESTQAEVLEPAREEVNELLKDKKTQAEILSLVVNALNTCEGRFDPHAMFYAKMTLLSIGYTFTDCGKKDQELFKQIFKAAVDDYALVYRKAGKSDMADYIKAAGMALLGVLVTLMTSPAFLVSSNHGYWLKKTFFSGPETDKSRAVQKKMDKQFAENLLKSEPEENDGWFESGQYPYSRGEDGYTPYPESRMWQGSDPNAFQPSLRAHYDDDVDSRNVVVDDPDVMTPYVDPHRPF